MYFIEAAQNIMENEGIENITLRKVADMAGYNSSTLYKYFKNLDHL
ncbi:TetR/AcrR family transcriptional regulator, partial [Clostridioides difficile]